MNRPERVFVGERENLPVRREFDVVVRRYPPLPDDFAVPRQSEQVAVAFLVRITVFERVHARNQQVSVGKQLAVRPMTAMFVFP